MKILTTILLLFIALISYSQEESNHNIAMVQHGYTQLNFTDYAELGGMLGINFKDIGILGLYHQISIKGNSYGGVYTQINVNPKTHYCVVCLSLKTGLVNGQYVSFEPALTVQINNSDDRYRITHSIGSVGGLPGYTFGIMFGNFGKKHWK